MLLTSLLNAKDEPLKVAIIGGIFSSGMWSEIADAFEKKYLIKTEVLISGNKKELDEYCRKNSVDFVTMHSSDTISNLVADGFFEQLTPWVRNAQMIVGSTQNIAKIDKNDTLVEALKKIESAKAPFLIHPSGGSFEVFEALKDGYDFYPNTLLLDTKKGFLKEVVKQDGYTLFGVIPFLMQKHSNNRIKSYYIEDSKLQRPYLAAIAPKTKIEKTSYENAQKLLLFLNSQEVQKLIESFRMKGFEEYQIFFPIHLL